MTEQIKVKIFFMGVSRHPVAQEASLLAVFLPLIRHPWRNQLPQNNCFWRQMSGRAFQPSLTLILPQPLVASELRASNP